MRSGDGRGSAAPVIFVLFARLPLHWYFFTVNIICLQEDISIVALRRILLFLRLTLPGPAAIAYWLDRKSAATVSCRQIRNPFFNR
jgi:hypothetical protein